MRYVAIEMHGRYEMGLLRAKVDDLSWKESPAGEGVIIDSDDPSRISRGLYNYLQKEGYPSNEDGTISVVAFGIVRVQLLVGLITLGRYIDFQGGIHNPNLLGWTTGPLPYATDSERVDVIIELVREHFLKQRSKRRKNALSKS